MKVSPNIERISPSATIAVSSLAKRLAAEGRDILNLGAGEPDFATPRFAAEAGIRSIEAGKTGYTPAPGLPELRKAIAADLARRSGREVDWTGIVVSNGAKHALFNAIFGLFGPGDRVMIAAPYWTSYPEMVLLARAEPQPVRGPVGRDFRLTPSDLDDAWSDDVRGLILCSPGNPTGSVYSAEELEAVARWARDRDIWLISDEIYRRIYYPSDEEDRTEAAGLLDLPEEALGRHVLIDGVSKSFAMTGWRIGFSATTPNLASELSALQSHITSNASAPAQYAALEAYRNQGAADEAIAGMVEAFRRRRDLVVEGFREKLPGFDFVEPRGAFYLFFDAESAFGDEMGSASDFCTRLLEEEGVALVPGEAFGAPAYVRMSFAASDEVLTEAIGRIARFVG